MLSMSHAPVSRAIRRAKPHRRGVLETRPSIRDEPGGLMPAGYVPAAEERELTLSGGYPGARWSSTTFPSSYRAQGSGDDVLLERPELPG